MKEQAKKILELFNVNELTKTKKVLKVNPTIQPQREVLLKSILSIYEYNNETIEIKTNATLDDVAKANLDAKNTWLNVDVINEKTANSLAQKFCIHPLIIEDILSINQRPKTDEIKDQIFCLMQMMYYNKLEHTIENEQLSIVLGNKFLITFQDDETRDHFNPIRQKLQINNSRLRENDTDYLLYSLLDSIVDNYYTVIEELGESIEHLEEDVSKNKSNSFTMSKINSLRKEMIVYRRNVVPTRDLIKFFIETDNPLIKPVNKKYFKDVLDHIEQAVDLSDNYRDIVASIRDLYINQINLKSNETMKALTVITALLAPATVIGGIFGMNFDKIPYLHNTYGFWIAVTSMIIIPLFMLLWFKKKGWY